MRDTSARRRRRAGRCRLAAAEELRRCWHPGRASLPTLPDRARLVRGPGPEDRREGGRPVRGAELEAERSFPERVSRRTGRMPARRERFRAGHQLSGPSHVPLRLQSIPMAQSEPDTSIRWFWPITALAAGLGVFLFLSSYPSLIYDSYGYSRLAQNLITEGLMGAANESRTYGYPLFVAICCGFLRPPPEVVRLLVFVV